jgi:transposase-like protein
MPGHKWHLDEIDITIGGTKQLLWQAIDQNGVDRDILSMTAATKRPPKDFCTN